MRTAIFTLILIALFSVRPAFGQETATGVAIRDSLSSLSSGIWKQKTDSARLGANEVFYRKFEAALHNKTFISFPFDSIQGITRIASVNGDLRIFTWNIPLSSGINRYFGFIQIIQDSADVIPLRSTASEPADIETFQLEPNTWYGALYYKLIEEKIGEKRIFTLLAWDGYALNSNRKIIDILTIDNSGNVRFGLPVFKTADGIKSRVIMEYAEKSSMVLRYDYQSVLVKKRKKVKKEGTWLIVFDRLIPMDPTLKGIRKYYVPAGDTYDGFIFRNGFWVLAEDIDVVNKVKNSK
ncbi:MAG: hypothetical protein WCR72_04035 [Bacteroidota bacterium]